MKIKVLVVLAVLVMFIFGSGLIGANLVPSANGVSQPGYYTDDDPNTPAEPNEPDDPNEPNIAVPE
ncbi:MAG: hypothetical protein ABSE89_00630 [Sedimentisphaerales bacterium]